MTDTEILDTNVGGRLLRDMTALEFYGYIAGKMNGLAAYKSATVELRAAVANPPMSRLLPDLEKVRLCRKLLELDVAL